MSEWEERWRSGQTGWDRGEAAPPLLELLRKDDLPVGRALVPGCGAGYDVLALAAPDRYTVGLDIAPAAAERFEALRTNAQVPLHRATVIVGDFFAYQPEAPFDLVWDYTFLCAIEPSRRPEWVERMRVLVAPHGELVTLLYPTSDAPPSGPPFLLDVNEVRSLLEPVFAATHLAPSRVSHPQRAGREWLARWRHRT
ncbi:MAG: methyltransferase domain-containing protein [Sandaracinaceae bacterium]|nr:methyltransferase domain-containing protein [Sandaracinaceae bacterium]